MRWTGKFRRWTTGALLSAGLLCVLVQAQIDYRTAYRERVVTALRVEEPIIVDGELDEPAWGRAQPAGNFIQKLPRTGEPASEATEVRLLYDDQNLYVGVFCYDSAGPSGIVVNDITRDFFTLDSDGFQIVLDTFDDNRNSFLFGTNPKGGRFDMQIGADGDAGNTDWDGIWYVETKITEKGWQVEMAIPFKTLRFNHQQRQTWGVNFERRVRRKFEDSYWAPLPPPYRLGRVSLAGTLEGLENLPRGLNLYVKPYATAPVVRRQRDDVDFQPDLGLDVKYGVSSQLTLDVTVNTDFSQVEADEEQVNLTRFSLFFPEKREFFLENAGIFQFGRRPRSRRPLPDPRPDLIPFFSRRIGISPLGQLVPIRGGARLTGRAGAYSVGLLSMQTAETDELPATNFSVVRLRRDLLERSDLGGIFINKEESGGGFNRTYGVDSNFNFWNYLNISSYLLKSDSPEVTGEEDAGNLEVSWRDPCFDVRAGHLWIGENFNPEVGFAPRRGIEKSSGEFAVTPRPEERLPWVREFRPSVEAEYITGRQGELETRRIEGRFSVTFADSSFLSFARETNFERLDEPFRIRRGHSIPVGEYHFDAYSAFFQSNRSRAVSALATFTRGDFFNGERTGYGTGVTFQPSYRLAARLVWNHNDIDLPTGHFTTNLVTSRLDYSFSTRLFLNALIQYNSDDREISSNIRLNFIHKPLSDFFLVYNERRSTTGEVTERALIAKLTYMFSF